MKCNLGIHTDPKNKALARYISKEMVLKLTGKDAPIEVTAINLTLSKEDGKKIQVSRSDDF